MTVKTLFARGATFERGEVEIKLMPGLPLVHVVGRPDVYIRETGVRIKAALRSAGYQWPRGHQVIVNLRPTSGPKQSAGIDLAVALGLLRATKQLRSEVVHAIERGVVYGELALDGRVFAPRDVDRALRALGDEELITGAGADGVRSGSWLEFPHLSARALTPRAVEAGGSARRRPELPPWTFTPRGARALLIAAHAELSVLVAGPQGSGKTTWARALHALSRPPRAEDARARARYMGDSALDLPWRPLEQPHHSTPTVAMIGGGRPLRAGVITRAHGGVLLMDEFLEFAPAVLEALREPVESGWVELARAGERDRLPARFQWVATSNLCPCGELNPDRRDACRFSLTHCRRVCQRLSGPVLDRFDLLVPSHQWLREAPDTPLAELPRRLERLEEFRRRRGPREHSTPLAEAPAGLSHRRSRAIGKVARALADFDEALEVDLTHVQAARALVVTPMENLRTVFG